VIRPSASRKRSMVISGMPVQHTSETEILVADLARKYVWWEQIGNEPPSEERVIAQAMNFATFADIRHMEKVFGPERLTQVMLRAAPGWFSDRSWEFWRGRLSFALGKEIPEEPPRRSLHTATL
jgi:hypothetical protein